jgi:hypothetical protein
VLTLLSLTIHVSRKLWFEDQQGRARVREEEEEARRRKAHDRLASLMRHSRVMGPDTSWEQFLEAHGKDKEVKDVNWVG